jgi:hypothetical protein
LGDILMAFLAIAPIGTVLPFAGTSAPDGWLLCDGSEKSRTTYSKLFAVISTIYGVGDGSTTFNIPDMRGVFPRGQGTNGTSNYGGVTGHTPAGGALAAKGGQKTAKNGLGNAASGVSGTANGQGGGSHNHQLYGRRDAGNIGTAIGLITNDFTGDVSSVWGAVVSLRGAMINEEHTHSASSLSSATAAAQTISGDAETTPASLALNYIIKL